MPSAARSALVLIAASPVLTAFDATSYLTLHFAHGRGRPVVAESRSCAPRRSRRSPVARPARGLAESSGRAPSGCRACARRPRVSGSLHRLTDASHACFRRSVILPPLRFPSRAMDYLGEDSHLQVGAHAGRTNRKRPATNRPRGASCVHARSRASEPRLPGRPCQSSHRRRRHSGSPFP